MDQVAREQDLASDSLFKWIVVSSSALAMGVTLGLLGGLIIDRDTGLSLHWHWSIVLWAAAGVSATIYVWKTVWAAGKDENPATKRQVKRASIVLVIVCLAACVYPFRFVFSSYGSSYLIGGATAVVVLSLAFSLIRWLVHLCEEQDRKELARQEREHNH